MTTRLILASASPRRKALLTQLGLNFAAIPTNASEIVDVSVLPATMVQRIAERKLDAYVTKFPQPEFVLAVDTEVVLDRALVGKPKNREDAKRILLRLQGRNHDVLSALSLQSPDGKRRHHVEESQVSIAPLTVQQVDSYVETMEPMDKAGGYAIQGQGAAFVRSVVGDYTNVIGLPIRSTLRLLHDAGFPLPAHLRV